MKQNNKYSRAMENIKPDENFVNDTLEKLEKAAKRSPKRGTLKIAAPIAAALAVAVLAVSVLPNAFKTDNVMSSTGDQTVYNDAAPLSTSMPIPMPVTATYEMSGEMVLDVEEWAFEEPTEEGFFFPDAYNTALFNTDEFAYISESGFKSALTSPLSTFAADVDTAGYSTVRRMILSGSLPSESSIRAEEMLNYFKYQNLAPEDGTVKISACLGACPWNEDAALMFVGVGAQQIDTSELPRSNLVFLIDTSGSMDGSDRLDLVKRAFKLLCDTLTPGDIVSIVTYSGSFNVLLEGVDASERIRILDAVDSLKAWGSTNGGDAMITAYQLAEKYFIEGGNNRIIMMTDGDLNVGITSQSELVDLVEEKKQGGVFLSVLGFGMGNLKDSRLEALADHGNGVYSYIDGINEARRVLVTEMGANFYTVAKDVKIQVEFNPEYVSAYRLIGYENRQMPPEDFADDSKDGGEMGSGHTVVALYELIPAEGKSIAGVSGKAGQGETSGALRYQKSEISGMEEIARIALRYKQPDSDTSSEISCIVTPDAIAEGAEIDNLRLASAIAEFAMALRDSDYKGSATFDSAAELVKGLSVIGDDEAELLYLITTAKRLAE